MCSTRILIPTVQNRRKEKPITCIAKQANAVIPLPKECPGNRKKNNYQLYRVPGEHSLEFFVIRFLSLHFHRSDGEKHNRKGHHRNMFHSKKTDLTHVDGFFKVVKKIIHHRADKIQPQ